MNQKNKSIKPVPQKELKIPPTLNRGIGYDVLLEFCKTKNVVSEERAFIKAIRQLKALASHDESEFIDKRLGELELLCSLQAIVAEVLSHGYVPSFSEN